ncbi:MAG TPA: beta-ketoacyl-ACP synthase III [Deinococcales bacterium]|nr:beta-ketoacyl-ACP synthase III [Deinococcales bacterium]
MPQAARAAAAGLTALGSYVPDKVLTNQDLESMVDMNDEWIRSRTGIRERRIAQPDEYVSTLAMRAVEDLRARYGAQVLDGVDMVIVATNTPDALFPSTAALVQAQFGLSAGAFDVLAACPGWMYALAVAHGLVMAGTAKKVLAIGSEVLSKITDWTDRSTCVLFGDGAAAGIVEPVPDGFGFKSLVLGADGAGAKHLHYKGIAKCLPDGTELATKGLFMNGREVFKFAVRVMDTATIQAVEQAGIGLDDIELFVPHQANQRIIEAARERLNLPTERVMSNVERYGNTSTASIGIALREALDSGRVKHADDILLVTFGAGLTWASGVLRWYQP